MGSDRFHVNSTKSRHESSPELHRCQVMGLVMTCHDHASMQPDWWVPSYTFFRHRGGGMDRIHSVGPACSVVRSKLNR